MLEEWLPLANESLLCYSSFKLKKNIQEKGILIINDKLNIRPYIIFKKYIYFLLKISSTNFNNCDFQKKKLQSVIYDNLYNARPLNSISFKRVQNFLKRFLFFLLNRTKVIKIKLTVVSFISSHPQNWLLFTLWLTSN